MRAGLLRHYVTIQRAIEGAPNAANEKAIAWAPLRTVSASIDFQGGAERFDGKAFTAAGTVLIVIRWPHGISVTPKDRITHGTRIFDIDSVDDRDGRRRELRIVARERLQ